MNLKREHLAVIGAASKDPTRLLLTGLKVTPDTVVATDSFGMIAMEREPDGGEDGFECILPPGFVKEGQREAVRSGGITISRNGDGKIEATSLALDGMETIRRASPIEGGFPNWQRVDPGRKGQERIARMHLDPKLLRDLLGALVRAGATAERGGVYLELYRAEPGKGPPPLVFVRSNGEDEAILAALMPMQEDEPSRSAWLDRIRKPEEGESHAD